LAVFKSYKLDDTQASRKKLEELKTGGEHVYFAKFLTSEKVRDFFSQNHRLVEVGRSLRLVRPPCSKLSARAGWSALCLVGFWMSPQTETPQFLWVSRYIVWSLDL